MVALAIVSLFAFSAWATGTPAGTVIKNTAVLNYKDVNGNPKAAVSDSVETIVATKRGVNVSPDIAYSANTEDKVTEYAFTITNTGNATDTIELTAAGLNLDPGWTYEILIDANGNGAWDPGENTPVSSVTLLQDASYKVIVRVTAPATANYNAINTITLTATSEDGPAAAQDTGVINITLTSANVTMTKVASTTVPVPLQNFTFTIEVKNSDLETAAYLVSVEDTLDADLVWVSNSATLGTATYDSNTRKITWTIVTLPKNSTATLSITVYVGEGVPKGAAITNTATVSYDDYNGNTYTGSASSEPGTTQQLAGVEISTNYPSPSNVNPGDTITVPFTITNTGNGTDSFNLSYTDGSWALTDGSSVPIIWTFYIWNDDGDGIVEPGELVGPVSNTGNLAKDGTITLIAVATVPANAAYTASSSITITATSTSDPTKNDNETIVNNVQAPLLTLSKAVDKASAKPGETLTYTLTITNIGDGAAKAVVLVDMIPSNTTYVAGSIKVGPGVQTDGAGDDYADFNVTNVGAVTVLFDNLAAGITVVIEFKVTVN